MVICLEYKLYKFRFPCFHPNIDTHLKHLGVLNLDGTQVGTRKLAGTID